LPMFGIDTRLPNMVYAAVAHGPAIGARVASANLDEIKKMRGVKDAFVLEQHGDPIAFGTGGGQGIGTLPGIAIVADSTWNAFQAKKALKVEWDESNASQDSWTAAVAEAKKLAAAVDTAQPLGQPRGDVDAAFAE